MSLSWAWVRLPTTAAGEPGVDRQVTGATASRAKATNRSTRPDCVQPSVEGPADERAKFTGAPGGGWAHSVIRPLAEPTGKRPTSWTWRP